MDFNEFLSGINVNDDKITVTPTGHTLMFFYKNEDVGFTFSQLYDAVFHSENIVDENRVQLSPGHIAGALSQLFQMGEIEMFFSNKPYDDPPVWVRFSQDTIVKVAEEVLQHGQSDTLSNILDAAVDGPREG